MDARRGAHHLSPAIGLLAALALVAVCTAVVYPLKQITSVASLGVVYLLGAHPRPWRPSRRSAAAMRLPVTAMTALRGGSGGNGTGRRRT